MGTLQEVVMATDHHEEFYSDLDKNKHKPTVTCGSLIFFLAVIFLMLGYIVFWGVSQLKTKITSPKITISQSALERAEGKLQEFLQGKKDKQSPIVMTLTDQELSSLLVKNEIQSQDEKFGLKDPTATIHRDGIDLTATLTKPLVSRLQATIRPVVDNGELKTEVLDVKAGKLTIPTFLRSGVSDLLDRLVTDRLNSSTIIYETATLGEGILTLTGKTK